MSTRPSAARPSRRNRASASECWRSGPSRALASRKTVTASSNDTPCFAALASAFRGSHSNTYSVYTECRGMLSATDQEAVAHATRQTSQAEEGPEARPRPTRPGAREVGGPQQPDLAKRSAHLRPRDSGVRRVVLFGATSRLQSHGGPPVSDSPRAAAGRACHHQPPPGRRSARGVRGG